MSRRVFRLAAASAIVVGAVTVPHASAVSACTDNNPSGVTRACADLTIHDANPALVGNQVSAGVGVKYCDASGNCAYLVQPTTRVGAGFEGLDYVCYYLNTGTCKRVL